MQYLNFDLLVDKWQEQYKVRVLNSPSGQTSCLFDLPLIIQPANALLASGNAQEMGLMLFTAAFADQVGSCWHSSVQLASQKSKGLRLRLRLADVPELAALPWEYLYSSMQKRFLSLSIETPIVRYLELPQTVPSLNVQAPLRILVMIANPYDAAPLDGEEEWQRLRQALSRLEQQGLVSLTRLSEGTWKALQEQLRKQNYHIFHFIGHGFTDALTKKGGVLLENEHKKAHFVPAQQLGTLLHDHRSLRLVLLNACEGTRPSVGDAFSGTAQHLVQQGIPAVIAMQSPIQDKSAIAFASSFYAALADGYPIDAALSEGRKSLLQEDDLAWGIPVLYMRSPDGQLFEVGRKPSGETNQSEIIGGIVLHLYQQPLGEKVSLTELLKALALSEPQVVIDALSKLESMDCVEMSVAAPTAMLCWLTHNGRKLAADFQRPADRKSAADSVSAAPAFISQIRQPESKAIEQFPQLSWTLEALDQEHAYVVQRQDLLERIQRILENPSDNRMAFLYGPAQVGKTSVLKQLKNRLPDQYVCMLIHLNGWLSIRELSTFLNDLVTNIKSCPEFWESGYQIEPFRQGPEIEATIEFSRFMNQLIQNVRAKGKFLLLMFDELEYLTHKDTDSRIFDYLTGRIESYLDQEVRFIFAGSGEILDLVNSGSLARLWGKGERVKMECFERDISRDLIIALTSGYFQFEERAIERMIGLGNGHPNLLRRTLHILVEYWRRKWRKNRITENDLNDVLKEICVKLAPELRDIWSRLSLLEQEVLQRIALIRRVSFRIDEVTIGSEAKHVLTKEGIERCLEQLVRLQILDYVKRDNLYIVRLGFIIESLSYGLLSVRSKKNS